MKANKKLVIATILALMVPHVVRAICVPGDTSDISEASSSSTSPTSSPLSSPSPQSTPSSGSVAPTPGPALSSHGDEKSPSISPVSSSSEPPTPSAAYPSQGDDNTPSISPSTAPSSEGDTDSPSLSTSAGAPAGLQQICSNTDYPELCIDSIKPFFSGNPEPINVLGVAIKAATMQAKLAIAIATKMANAVGVSRTASTALQDCSDQYEDVIDNLQTAMDAVKSRDIGTINSMLSAVITDSWTCDDEFVNKNPMAVYEEKLGNLASNCLAIASLVKD